MFVVTAMGMRSFLVIIPLGFTAMRSSPSRAVNEASSPSFSSNNPVKWLTARQSARSFLVLVCHREQQGMKVPKIVSLQASGEE